MIAIPSALTEAAIQQTFNVKYQQVFMIYKVIRKLF